MKVEGLKGGGVPGRSKGLGSFKIRAGIVNEGGGETRNGKFPSGEDGSSKGRSF